MFFLRCCTFYIRIMNDSDANLCRSKPIMIRSFAHVCIKTTLLTSYHSKFSNIKIFSKVKKGDVNCGTWWWIYVQKINFISNAISIVNHLWCKSNPIIPILFSIINHFFDDDVNWLKTLQLFKLFMNWAFSSTTIKMFARNTQL